jgi:hypothetical protein
MDLKIDAKIAIGGGVITHRNRHQINSTVIPASTCPEHNPPHVQKKGPNGPFSIDLPEFYPSKIPPY